MEKAPKADAPATRAATSNRDVDEGIARILVAQSEASNQLKQLISGATESLEQAAGSIPNIELFYNLEEIFSQMAHEGRNYVSPIMGYASLLSESTSQDSREHHWANKIVHSVRLIESYFGQLDIYRMKNISHFTEIGWKQFLDSTVESFMTFNRRKSPIRIKNSVKGKVLLHTELLRRVLLHILRNAYESAPDDGVINVEAVLGERSHRGAAGRRTIRVTIADQGPGIAHSKLEAIWKPFFSTKPSHFGLGLPFVAMGAAMLGLEIDVDTKEGRGTAVSVVVEPKGGHVETS